MDNPRAEKVALVGEVRSRLTSSDAALLTEYRGLKVGELAELRRALDKVGGQYKIYKNTLVRFAVAELGLDELAGLLQGPTAIAFVNGDAAEVAKVLRDFARTSPALVVKGGVLGSSPLSAKQANELADLPSRDVLLARLAGGLAAPMRQLAGLLQALPRSFAHGLKALIDLQGGPPVTEAAPVTEAPVPAAAPAVTEAPAPAEPPTAEPPTAEPPAATESGEATAAPETPAPGSGEPNPTPPEPAEGLVPEAPPT
ncbi:MAG: 50S ribosomal protein L10 [Acidimicrobiales bacterium]